MGDSTENADSEKPEMVLTHSIGSHHNVRLDVEDSLLSIHLGMGVGSFDFWEDDLIEETRSSYFRKNTVFKLMCFAPAFFLGVVFSLANANFFAAFVFLLIVAAVFIVANLVLPNPHGDWYKDPDLIREITEHRTLKSQIDQ